MSTSRRANYRIVFNAMGNAEQNLRGYLVIQDMGPWDRYPTITNAPEPTVAECLPLLRHGPFFRRLFYVDSSGDLAELVVRGNDFYRFAPAPCSDLETLKTTWPIGTPAHTLPR